MFHRKSKTEETQLALLVQKNGDISARNQLVMANLGLVHFMARQMMRPYLRYEDLLQEGMLGLIRATETFQPDRQLRFSTYGVFWVRAKIQQFIQSHEKERAQQVSGFPIESLCLNMENPEEQVLLEERSLAVRKILFEVARKLGNPKLRTIIERRILAEAPESLEEVGKRLHISRETCRLLESKMLNLMRDQLANWRS